MTIPEADQRSKERRALDEQIAAEPRLPPPEMPPDSRSSSVETHIARHRRRPLAVAGVVENGLIRPLDPAVILPEHSRVIIVAAEQTLKGESPWVLIEGLAMEGLDESKLDGGLPGSTYLGLLVLRTKTKRLRKCAAAGADAILPLVVPMLNNADVEIRCSACEVLLLLNDRRAVELVLPLLQDSDVAVRLSACECLWKLRDDRAVAPLLTVLQSDVDAQVRNMAASAMRSLGGPAVIPALLATMASDHELDMHGHSPSHCAAMALDDILGTNETRIRVSETCCKMLPGKPDLDRLRRLAEARYQQWLGGDTKRGVAPDFGDM